ncbi:MAG: NAD-dependent epimerase/dehydratase family protein [Bacteroidota bacterium]
MNRIKRVLIFGGEGFIGSHYRRYLQDTQKYIVKSFDIKSGSDFIDVRNKISIKYKFSSSDIIINLAAVHTTPGHPDHEYFETNIKGAKNVCQFADLVGINNIIFTSSIAPYGASEEEKTEETLPTPNTPYGISKLVAEEIHKTWAAKDPNRKLLILRPGVVFGKGENGNFTRLASAISKGLFFYPGRKDTIKANIYVKELVHQSWQLFNDMDFKVETFNCAYYPSLTIEEIAQQIAIQLDKKSPRLVIPGFFLKTIAQIFKILGLGKIGIHPERVKKLMTSTNISGKKLRNSISGYKYTFKEALEDWYEDCSKLGLY